MRVSVIGSGFGGLSAAVRLAAAGHEVDVFEKRDRIGGRAYQYEIDGFRFDGGPTVLTAPFMFEELFALAGERLADHVDLVPLDPFYRVFDADGRPFDYTASLDSLLDEVQRRSPDDVAGVAALMSRISRIASLSSQPPFGSSVTRACGKRACKALTASISASPDNTPPFSLKSLKPYFSRAASARRITASGVSAASWRRVLAGKPLRIFEHHFATG